MICDYLYDMNCCKRAPCVFGPASLPATSKRWIETCLPASTRCDMP